MSRLALVVTGASLLLLAACARHVVVDPVEVPARKSQGWTVTAAPGAGPSRDPAGVVSDPAPDPTSPSPTP